MSKITFRADDDLIAQLEEFDASKSEVMREALREYLGEPTVGVGTDGTDGARERTEAGTLDDILLERIDELIEERLGARVGARSGPQDINVNISLDGDSDGASVEHRDGRKTGTAEAANADEERESACKQCGETLSPSAVYCSNCGEKASHRVFCECGDEMRSDWAFCPSCGRRTPAADVLDRS
jgi:Arc/MetJ-type ribon-helix-helix transcriptional regulator